MILVTGATGFVGRRVVSALASAGRPVRALVRTPSRASVLSAHDVEIVQGDVLDPESLARACDGVDAVIHLVAVLRERGEQTYQQVNYQGTTNLLEAAKAAGVMRIVHASALGCSSDPSLPYLNSRWMAEQEVARSTVPYTIVRFALGFGEGDEFFNVLAAQIKLSPVVPLLADSGVKFQPIAVEDVARCLVTALEREDAVDKTIEAGGPEYYTNAEMVDLVANTLGARIAKVRVPLGLVRPLIGVMEALVPQPPATREMLKMLNVDGTTSLDSVERAFGFKPMSLKGNLDHISSIGLRDALQINLGFMPPSVRDH